MQYLCFLIKDLETNKKICVICACYIFPSYSGGKHQFIVEGDLRVRIHNPHKKDIGKNLLKLILKEAEISKETWEKL